MFEHVGISSLDVITEVEMDGAACLQGKSATKCGVGDLGVACRFKNEWSDFVIFGGSVIGSGEGSRVCELIYVRGL